MRLICFIACLSWSSIIFSGSIDPVTAVNEHNEWRNLLNQGRLAAQPRPNPFLADMYWDESLAESSQHHSDQCVWQHSGTGGENLFAQSGTDSSIADAINNWSEEYTSYDYNSNGSIDGKQVGHYTQLVWDDSLRVGCAKNYCNPIKYPDGEALWPGIMYTCQYRSSGNWVGQKPYSLAGAPSEIAHYSGMNKNLFMELFKIGGVVYRIKMEVKTFTPPVFSITNFEQVKNVDLSQYPEIAYFDGSSIIIPKLIIEAVGSYSFKLKYLGDLDFELIEAEEI